MIRTYNRHCLALMDRSIEAEERRQRRRDLYAANVTDEMRARHRKSQAESVARKKLNNNRGPAA